MDTSVTQLNNDLVNQIKQIDTGSHYIYMGSDPDHARKALKARCHYFISKPFDPEEVIEILGAPHDYRGSGIVRDVYRLSDGGEVSIHYQWGSIDSFSKRDKNDVLIKIQ